MSEVRCKDCGHYIGEAVEEVVVISVTEKSHGIIVQPPRDVRFCRSCGAWVVCVPKEDLEARLAS